MTIRAGDVLRHEQPGGGGHGDPALRDPAAVAHDLADGKITAEHAREFYGTDADDPGERTDRPPQPRDPPSA